MKNLFAEPKHPYTSALLAANPEPNPGAQQKQLELKGEVPSLLNRPSGCEFHTRCPFVQNQGKAGLPDLIGEEAHRYRCNFPLTTVHP